MPSPREFDIAPTVLTTSSTVVVTGTASITSLTLTNETASAATVTIKDGNGVFFFDAVSIPANSTSVFSIPDGRTMPVSISWLAGTASAIVAEMKGFYGG